MYTYGLMFWMPVNIFLLGCYIDYRDSKEKENYFLAAVF